MKITELFHTNRSTLEKLEHSTFTAHDVRVLVKRDDLIDDLVSGNKWRKLKYNLMQMKALGKSGVLTFGGAYSNHLIATAAAANRSGIKAVGVVRGDELHLGSNDTLRLCDELGMELKFVSRSEYSERNDHEYLSGLKSIYKDLYIIPEGGANFYGMIGCQEIIKEIDHSFDSIFVAQGTATTSCGIASALGDAQLFVVPVLKGFNSIEEMNRLYKRAAFDTGFLNDFDSQVKVLADYHFGGYAKHNTELLDFIRMIYRDTGLKLDPIYTGKTFFALFDQVVKGGLDGQTIVFVHTGGLNGVKGVEKQSGIKIFE